MPATHVPVATEPTALENLEILLETEARAASTLPGYLDLLGPEDAPITGTAQRLMLTEIVPRIYERWWRPALGQVAKGLLGPTMGGEHRMARLLLDLVPGDGVLDVACGPGNFTRDFARRVGPEGLAVGIDASASMLARAVEESDPREVAYVRADVTRMPFRDASFDAVCCFAALHLFGDPFAALDEMRRVLAPGGRLAIFTSARPDDQPWRLIADLVGAQSGMRIFGRDEIVRALRERGLVEVRQRLAGATQFVGGRVPVG
jgi:SAM-dependent methyltransferase